MDIKSFFYNNLCLSFLVLVFGGSCFADCPNGKQGVRRTFFPVIAEINPGENVMLPLTFRVCTKKIGKSFKSLTKNPRNHYEKKLVQILSSIKSEERDKLKEMSAYEQKGGRILMESDMINLGVKLTIKQKSDVINKENTKIIERINFGDEVLFVMKHTNSDSEENFIDVFRLKEIDNRVYLYSSRSSLYMLLKKFYSGWFSGKFKMKHIKSYRKKKYDFSRVIHTGNQKQNSVIMNFNGRTLNYKRVQNNVNDATNDNDPISFYRETMQLYFDQKLSKYKKRLTAGARETFIKEKKEFGKEFIKKGIQEQRSKERFLVFVIEADPVYFIFSSVGDRKDISYQDISVSAVVKHEENKFRLSNLSYASYFASYLKGRRFYIDVLKPILKKQD